MQATNINWTDFTWNPASGCDEVSPECAYCYAKTLAENRRGTSAFPNGFDVMERPWKLDEPRTVKAPSLIFTNSMTDMFHEKISDDYRIKVLAKMFEYPQHRYQVLTKRPERAVRFFRGLVIEPPPNLWLGVTVGVNRTRWRIDELRKIGARVLFLSCEPLLELLVLDLDGIAWVIGGGESGTHSSQPKVLARRFLVRRGDRSRGEPLWVPREDRVARARALRDQAKAAGAAFWWKQWGGPRPGSGGRELDGRTWDEMPTHVAGAMPDGWKPRSEREPAPKRRRLPMAGGLPGIG